eukprot:TCALIF_01720-PA protein Name:"Similar to Pde9a High affinity cGMP-specific 3',5'-cyclic phosphodiesterase 9A (Mus musculus)" AED:0.11 eAED:0.11 QI:0/0.85/0.75/0.87/1/1/8/156/331
MVTNPEHNTYSITMSSKNTRRKVQTSLSSPEIDIWSLDTNQMKKLMLEMYEELELLQILRIDSSCISRFLDAVEGYYHSNPFHNFRHSFCVTQMMFVMIQELTLSKYFQPLELAALLTACICHDLDHPGLNNTYQINAKTELARRFRDKSPLENHHAEMASCILDDVNLFQHLSLSQQKEIKEDITFLILSTDMSRHNDILGQFVAIADQFDFNNPRHRSICKSMLIKACDVSNECRPVNTSEKWVDCLLEEYFNQSDLEKSSGLPYAPHMDRDKVTKANSQVGFISAILIPMFQSLTRVFPSIETLLLKNLREALSHYETQDQLKGDNTT